MWWGETWLRGVTEAQEAESRRTVELDFLRGDCVARGGGEEKHAALRTQSELSAVRAERGQVKSARLWTTCVSDQGKGNEIAEKRSKQHS